MPHADLAGILQALALVGILALTLRLFLTGLWRHYPVFFWYFLFRIPNTSWPLVVKNGTFRYEELWISTEPISWIFHILVVVELYRLVLYKHKGIYSLLRWAMYSSVTLAIGLSILSLLPKIQPQASADTRILGYWFATGRGIDFALAIFLLFILLFLSRFPVQLNRNTLLHAGLYTLFFFGNALVLFVRTLAGSSSPYFPQINVAGQLISIAAIYCWVFLLNKRGEEVKRSFLPTFSVRHEEMALRQLEALNATLLRASRK
jgi:hypothetical protein